MGLSEAGLKVPTASEVLDRMFDVYETLTGLTLDRTRTDDQFVAIAFTAVANQIGGVFEMLQAVYDGTNIDAAVGKQLEDGAYLVGVEPEPATRSQVTVTLTGTTGTIIPVNSIVEGGNTDDDARWLTSASVTLVAGTGSVVATAQEAGPINAAIGVIDKIVTAVPGWTGVTNAAAASPGTDRESDNAIRLRRRVALKRIGSASTSAIRAEILTIDEVTEVIILENNSSTAQVISSKALNGNSIWIFITPKTLTTAQEDLVAEAIHLKVAAGTETMAGAVTRQVSDVGGVTSHTVKWDYGVILNTSISAVVLLEAGFELTDVSDAIISAITEFMATFGMGQTLRTYDLILATSGIDGIASIVFAASVGGLDYTPAIDELLTLTTVTVGV